jgi:hypothetical protein
MSNPSCPSRMKYGVLPSDDIWIKSIEFEDAKDSNDSRGKFVFAIAPECHFRCHALRVFGL